MNRTVAKLAIVSLLAVFLTGLAYALVDRLANGEIFLAAPLESTPPTALEQLDSRTRAQQSRGTIVIVGIAGFVLTLSATFSKRIRDNARSLFSRRYFWLHGIVIAASVFDAGTTVHLVNIHGLQVEVHPGIALFGYAFGRTLGVVLGKLLQLLLIECIAVMLRGLRATILLIVYAAFCFAAALWNMGQFL